MAVMPIRYTRRMPSQTFAYSPSSIKLSAIMQASQSVAQSVSPLWPALAQRPLPLVGNVLFVRLPAQRVACPEWREGANQRPLRLQFRLLQRSEPFFGMGQKPIYIEWLQIF
jgi:hypothetical protein